jgi:mRNA-degrading endonuclease toxin of MazEF toxin-antitoxin module
LEPCPVEKKAAAFPLALRARNRIKARKLHHAEQRRYTSKKRLLRRLGNAGGKTISRVERALRLLLDL